LNGLEVLRFGWTPSCLRLLLAAGADPGPVDERTWAIRCGLPRNHIKAAILECERLGGLKQEPRAEGLALWLQPVEFWRVTPGMEHEHWLGAWALAGGGKGLQGRLGLVTERMGLHEALHGVGKDARRDAGQDPRDAGATQRHPNPAGPPKSGGVHRNPELSPCAAPPDSGGSRDHVQDHDPVHDKTERPCLKHDHAVAHRISEKPAGLKNGAQMEQARDMIATYLHRLTPENQKRWERRVHENADLVVFSVEEAAARRERVENLAAYANRVYLSRVNLRGAKK